MNRDSLFAVPDLTFNLRWPHRFADVVFRWRALELIVGEIHERMRSERHGTLAKL